MEAGAVAGDSRRIAGVTALTSAGTGEAEDVVILNTGDVIFGEAVVSCIVDGAWYCSEMYRCVLSAFISAAAAGDLPFRPLPVMWRSGRLWT